MAILTTADLNDRLRTLAAVNPTGWNEPDVREDFIAPLVALLGYRRGTDYDVNREGSHALSKPWLFVGRQRIDIDYALTVYRKSFWIIEAKGAADREIGDDAVFQAYFYAIHPEVSARYFCVINGWRIQVFDVRTVGSEYAPVLDIGKDELPARFAELASLLGASKIRAALQERILSDIRDVMRTEIHEDQVNAFQRNVTKVLAEVRAAVEENKRAVFHRKHEESGDEFRKMAEEASAGQLIRVMFEFPRNGREFEIVLQTLIDRLSALRPHEQVTALENLDRTIRGPIATNHRNSLARVAVRLASNYDQVMAAAGKIKPSVTAKWVIEAVLSKYAEYPDLAVRSQLEAAAYRAFYKASFVDKSALEQFKAQAEEAKKSLPEEDLVYLMPSVGSERVRTVDRLATDVFHSHKRAAVAQIRATLDRLEKAERDVQERFEETFRRGAGGAGDVSFYESYGVPWDYEVSGLAGGLLADFNAAEPLVDERIAALLVARIRARGPDYAVNHVDCVLARHLLSNDRFQIVGAASDFEGGLDDARVRDLAPVFRLQKTGRNDDPRETKLTLTAQTDPGQFLKVVAEIDLGLSPPVLRLLSSQVLK